MMKKLNKILLSTLVLPLALSSTSALADHHSGDQKSYQGCHHDGGQHHKFNKKTFKQLNLTDAQKVQMKELRKSFKEELKVAKKDNKAVRKADRQQLRTLIEAKTFDQAAVTELMNKISHQQIDKKVAFAKLRHQMYNVLTPEQQASLKEMQAKKMEAHQ
ncbi:Spy/CpxP family protein refolding chaperone [Vibrio sp. SS-MA-C1-2]|uniref:Spy/CpxP family protein refolding chaperone n=1 Tax=Vibrio sp. SS-MA-C1-2 TaxID=2908646 RepID=UPI001F48F00B|nr:Spy/CpxP family protein refolding chaperone [Vibrio sp. SS-MA-C1-2]UJF17805.1 Spy/CpxP family protein refolding chaperone [Vibrio sp. SS-MA-C1-2]